MGKVKSTFTAAVATCASSSSVARHAAYVGLRVAAQHTDWAFKMCREGTEKQEASLFQGTRSFSKAGCGTISMAIPKCYSRVLCTKLISQEE